MADTKGTQSSLSWALILPVSLVALTALSLGYDAGVMSGAFEPITRDYKLNVMEQGLMMGILNIMAAPGAILGSWAADIRGRVVATAGTALVLIVGPLIIAFSPSFIILMVGRVITGLGVGFAFVIPPLYAAELAPPDFRGRLITATEVLINAGIVLGYLSAVLLHSPGFAAGENAEDHIHHGAAARQGVSTSLGWRLVTGLAAVPPMVVLVSIPFLPESPRWLAKRSRWDDVQAVLERLCEDPEEIAELKNSIREAVRDEEAEAGWGELICPTPVTRRMLAVGIGIAFFQQACGSEAMVYYSPGILEEYGVEKARHQNQSTIIIGLAKLLGAVLGGPFLDFAGRRAGVVISSGGCTVFLVGMALCLQMGSPYQFALFLLCSFMVVFELGLAPGAFVLGTESYPVSIRAKALALGMFMTRFLSGVVSTIFPTMIEFCTLQGTLGIFSALSFLGAIWAFCYVPETMGLPLEEVARLFQDAAENPIKGTYGAMDTKA